MSVEIVEQASRVPFYVVMAIYFVGQVFIAFYAFYKNRQLEKETSDDADKDSSDKMYDRHFSGNKSYGPITIFLTFFSTAYSGYTITGITSESTQLGWFAAWWLLAYNYMNASSLFWKPRLRRLSAVRGWMGHADPIIDRYNNRLLSLVFMIICSYGQLIYVMVQFYSLRAFITTISMDELDGEMVIWIAAGLMLFGEILGGMNSVVFTDAVQSVIMISSMILLPILATVWFGPVGSNIAYDCKNLVTLNCSEGILLERGAVCSGKDAVQNGCRMNIDPWNVLHPAVGWSEYFKPLYKTPNGLPWPEYSCFSNQTFDTSGSQTCQNPEPITGVNVKTAGIDAFWYWNQVPLQMWALAFTFQAVGFMPNMVSRYYLAKTDLALKKVTMFQVMFGGVIATLPAVLMGQIIAANLVQIYPKGDAYATLVGYCMDVGGFGWVVGLMACMGVMAALMSTADSAVISISTMLSRELLQNWVFWLKPQWKSPLFIKGFAIFTSAATIAFCAAMVCYDPEINDPDSLTYTYFVSYQAFCQFLGAVPILAALFLPKTSDWAVLGGYTCALIVYFVLKAGPGNIIDTKYFTPFEEPWIVFFDRYWSVFTCIFFVIVLSLLPLGEKLPTPKWLRVDTTQFDPDGQTLTYEKIKEAMAGTREPWKDPIGLVCMILPFITATLALPMFGTSYEGCNFLTYRSWAAGGHNRDAPVDGCAGVSLCGGIQCFIVPLLIIFPLNKLLICIGFTRWRTPEEEEPGFPWGKASSSAK